MTACTNMVRRGFDLFEEHRSITEACDYLEHATLIMKNATQQLKQIDAPMPAILECYFRDSERAAHDSMEQMLPVMMPKRLAEKVQSYCIANVAFFSALKEHYCASEQELAWYYASRSGDLDSQRVTWQLDVPSFDALQHRLDNPQPNAGLERLFSAASQCRLAS